MSVTFNTPVTNPPALIAVGVPAAVNLGTLTVGARYLVSLQNALSADRGGIPYSDIIEGWIKLGGAWDVAAELGDPISLNVPIEITPVATKDHLSFIRSVDTNYVCKIFVVRIDS